jgi:hypothetical protein
MTMKKNSNKNGPVVNCPVSEDDEPGNQYIKQKITFNKKQKLNRKKYNKK